MDLRTDTWFWAGLAHWDKDDWSITDRLMEFFRRQVAYKSLPHKKWLQIVDNSLLPGFMEESLHSKSFCKDLCLAFAFYERKKRWSSNEVRDNWVDWLRRACPAHSLPSPVR